MKFVFALLAITFAVASASELISEGEVEAHFNLFKLQYNRVYRNFEEELFRKRVFASNLEFIFRHNREFFAGNKNFNVAVNNFTDMSNTEFRVRFNGLKQGPSKVHAETIHGETFEALPATVDWTTKGIVTPIKNQEQCGSCWAFSAVASMEGQHALKTGKLVSLSEQNLVDCSAAEGNMGCEGGLMDQAFQYVIQNNGIDTEASYPYTALDDPSCTFKKNSVGATIKSFTDVQHGSESALQSAVATVGPISVGIDASQMSFQFYSSGVYDEPACSTTVLDHGVTAVGYGTLNGTPYWKVKNSWGSDWGQSGYIFMSRNKQNQCGIATSASYPVV